MQDYAHTIVKRLTEIGSAFFLFEFPRILKMMFFKLINSTPRNTFSRINLQKQMNRELYLFERIFYPVERLFEMQMQTLPDTYHAGLKNIKF